MNRWCTQISPVPSTEEWWKGNKIGEKNLHLHRENYPIQVYSTFPALWCLFLQTALLCLFFSLKKLQNSPDLLKTSGEITSGKDEIKIHSLILHQLSSTGFSDMIKYAWFASKLIEERTIFTNLNEMCFPISLLKNLCTCKTATFIKCAWCRQKLCYVCFYDKYHPEFCSTVASDSE